MTLSMQTSIDTNASPASDAADSRINCRFDKGKAMNPIDARRKFLLGASTAGLVGLLPSGAAVAQGPAVRRRLRILVLNPNTSTDFTKVITREARRVGAPDTDFVEATAPVGPRFIGTRTTIAVAEYGITEALARILAKDRQYDAAIVAGFGEPVGALREFAPFPVVAMLEASVVAAMQLGNKFSVLTGGAQWLPMLEEQIRVLGLLHRVASIRAIPLTGPEIVANQDRAMSLLAELSEACVRENGAECVILGGGAVAGIAPKIQDRVSVPLLDSVGVSVATAEMLARITTIPKDRKRPPSAESDGLSAELRDLLKNP